MAKDYERHYPLTAVIRPVLRRLWPIAGLTLLLLLLGVSPWGLWERDEGRYADVASEMLARGDFVTEEIEPRHEDGQEWRSLRITYPDQLVAHCHGQTYYFDSTGPLRRIDHALNLPGSEPAVQHPSRYWSSDGFQVPTRRRVSVRNPDGSPARGSVSIAIDVSHATFD